ncbi:hypothetical protein [Aggregatilinea lenta]|uniref:hypothetical protein n=1 Tax=Aggregatilinea lenta TaxID=913108 RepID=UPI0013C34540|nr:hypothetical protein [Aggregatilinea lenta]
MARLTRFGLTVAALAILAVVTLVPGAARTEAAVESVNYVEDCTHVHVTAEFSRVGSGYNDVSSWATIDRQPITLRPSVVLGPDASQTVEFDLTFASPLPANTPYYLHVDQWAGEQVNGVPTETDYSSWEYIVTCTAAEPDDPIDPPQIVIVPGGDTPPASRGQSSSNSSGVNRPGPDMVDMPEWSVMGQFNTATPLLYLPDVQARTSMTIDAGKTLWVLGKDDSGDFYEVVLSGVYLWAPVSSLQPVASAPWNGRALPGEVVN